MDEYGYKNIVGIDKSENMIIKAKQLSSDLNRKCIKYIADDCCFMDKQFLANSHSKFDVVVCQWLYLYANNVRELSLMIGNVSKMLKTDGIHVGCTTNPCLMADTTGDLYSNQWKEFGIETKCNSAMVKNKGMQFKDGEIRCSYATIFKLDDGQKHVQNEQKIGENCFELQGKFYTMETYTALFEKRGFTDVHWLSVDEYLAHPSLTPLEKERFQRYVQSNCIFAVFLMRKNGDCKI